ncbi:metallophosphoesterase [Patulibacter sp.]|uniref:metallophosphoesterase n=1 Tax=Patulibacter sp. TaxID=1912859 RepID=UPI002725725A|nr:metallophosphoesterase [Patulibacter sp.]MDO9407551.1 metallophosphoesterase [Patulibacter sp.]
MTVDAVPTTLVVSDLHLGSGSGTDRLRDPGPVQDALLDAVGDVERLVLAGDLLELRHASPRTILERAAPFLARLGGALGPDTEVLLLPGNHDHRLVRPWLHEQHLAGTPLALTGTVDPATASPVAGAVADALAAGAGRGPRLRVGYPAAWLVPPPADGPGGVLVTHGHYVDALWRMPTFERLSAGLAARSHGVTVDDLRTPDDFERVLSPGYGWMDALADHAVGTRVGGSQRASAGVWQRLNERGTWSGRGLRLAVPRVVAGLRRAGIDGLEDRLTPETLRLAGLRGMDRVAAHLGVRPAHLIVGHTHRAGPLPGDAAWEWRLERGGGRIWNTGSWVEDTGDPGGPDSVAYRPGRAVRIDTDGVPRLLDLVGGSPGR